MDLSTAVQSNLLSPPVLFFVLGCAAALLKSDLKFPEQLYVGLTIYLLTAIGFKGGVAVASAGIGTVLTGSLMALLLGSVIPLWSYAILRYLGRLSGVDSAAIAAHYGSVSAVTFIAATNFLKDVGQSYEPYASAFLAVMESPAIVLGVLLGRLSQSNGGELTGTLKKALHEALFGRSVLLLVGALIIGYLSGEKGAASTAGFFQAPFQGVLCLFLLEMGMVAARRFGDLRKVGWFLLGFGLLMPLLNGSVGIMLAKMAGLSVGGAVLLGVLAASASYIAAPAAMRLSLPEANPTFYLTASLAVTFPFNLAIGLPLYLEFARWWYGGAA
ncbi:MAG: sodium-dependent bicarbonate transport family permease [Verrucomicrobiota bacterium]